MSTRPNDLVEHLVADLRPVRPLRQRAGMARSVLSLVVGAIVAVLMFGIRPDITTGQPDPLFVISTGLFLVLALASAWTVVDMARPSVGNGRDGWAWTALAVAVLPVSATGMLILGSVRGEQTHIDLWGVECLVAGCIVGLATLVTLVCWLRRGAPSSPRLAATLTGVAAGAAGIFAISLHCPENHLTHVGIWHGGTVIVMGIVGRLTLPRLLAW